jgi:hypothetical protein
MELSNDPQAAPASPLEAGPHVPETDGNALLDELQKDFDRLKAQKARPTGGVEGSTLEALCMYNDEQYVRYQNKGLSLEPRDANKLYLVFNLIRPRLHKVLSRLAAFNAPFKARPNRKDPQATADAEVVDRLIIATDEKLDQPSRLREILEWLAIGGVAFEHVPWVPNATIEPNPQFEGNELLFDDLGGELDPFTGKPPRIPESMMQELVDTGAPPERFQIAEEVEIVGEVGSEVYGPLNVFIDSNVRSIADLPPGSWVHLAAFKTIGWIKENYPDANVKAERELTLIVSKIKADGDAAGGTYLKDLVPMVQGACDENDPEMVLHIISYQQPSSEHPHGRMVCWVPGQEILFEGDCPYEEVPLVDFHWTPATTTFWTKGYVTPLIAPQRFINKRMSQLGEQANASIYSNILLGAGLKADDIPADYPGAVVNGLGESGQPNVARMAPPEIPAWFLQSIEMAVKMFNDAAGATDLMEDSKFPGQLRGPLAVPMLQEILDTQWGPLFSHLGERLARVKQMRLNRIKQFYPPQRTLHYTDRTQKDEVLQFHTDKVLRAGTNFNITVERGSLLPELRALRESRVTERLRGPLAILYMDERTGRLDKSKIAADLQFGDTGREARESKYRKLAQEIIKMIWEGKQVPPVQPFYDHTAMLDELEDSMATTEFLKASQPIQEAFALRWQQHSHYLQQEAMAQQQAMQGQMIHSAVAQATQQAAAMAAADAVDQATQQVRAQNELPTDQYVAAAQGRSGGRNPGQREEKPKPKSRKVTLEEREG